MLSQNLQRRLINNIRLLEHEACAAEGPIIGLQYDLAKATRQLGVPNEFAADLEQMRESVCALQRQTATMHARMAELAAEQGEELVVDDLVNGGGGGKP